jgi:predicted metallopeptidase
MNLTRSRRPQPIPLELRWDARCPLPARRVVPDGVHPDRAGAFDRCAFDFTGRMRALCEDVTARCLALRHVRMSRVLVTFTSSRNRSRYGLQARVTPLRFRNGALTRHHGATEYQVQRYFVNASEMFYVLTFCLPRFLDQSFREKLVTVFHELYHVGPAFDGDLRRHPGRCTVHSRSKLAYDSEMGKLVSTYLVDHPEPRVFDFLRSNFRELCNAYGGVTGVVVPRPKLLPIGYATARGAARNSAGEGE